jgi:hypothetical protein
MLAFIYDNAFYHGHNLFHVIKTYLFFVNYIQFIDEDT